MKKIQPYLKILVPGLAVMLILWSVPVTKSAWREVTRGNELQSGFDSARAVTLILDQQQETLATLGELAKINDLNAGTKNFSQYLETICTRYSVKILSLPGDISSPPKNNQAITTNFSLQGSFRDIVQVLYHLEVVDRAGKITHLRWFREKIFLKGKREEFLVAQVEMKRG